MDEFAHDAHFTEKSERERVLGPARFSCDSENRTLGFRMWFLIFEVQELDIYRTCFCIDSENDIMSHLTPCILSLGALPIFHRDYEQVLTRIKGQ